LTLGTYKTINAEISIAVNDLLNQNYNDFNTFVSGRACLDFGFMHQPSVFLDVNAVGLPGLSTLFDVQVPLPVPVYGTRTSMFSFLEQPISPTGNYCIGESSFCNFTSQIFTNFIEDSGGSDFTIAEFKFANSQASPGQTFQLDIDINGNRTTVGQYTYNEDISNVIIELSYATILEAENNGTLSIIISDTEIECDSDFDTNETGFYSDCTTLYTDYDLAEKITFEDISLSSVTYYQFDDLDAGISLPSPSELETALRSQGCKNPTGYLVKNRIGDGYVKINSYTSYYWIMSSSGLPEVLAANTEIQGGEIVWKDFKIFKTSYSAFFPIYTP